MMHLQDTVVTLLDSNGNPFRETNSCRETSGRKCHISIPFDTEYKFLVRNMSPSRVKLKITIDGSIVTGNGLILNSFTSDTIERFVDVAKKFKFVRASNENVADPYNPENGVIKVEVIEETKPLINILNSGWQRESDKWQSPPYIPPYIPHPYDRNFYPYWDNVSNIGALRGVSCSTTMNYSSERGATIEGNNSNQTFGTTHWNGDGSVKVFTFYLKQASETESAEYKEYQRLKKIYG